jgi:hypothetical protein
VANTRARTHAHVHTRTYTRARIYIHTHVHTRTHGHAHPILEPLHAKLLKEGHRPRHKLLHANAAAAPGRLNNEVAGRKQLFECGRAACSASVA